MRTLVAAAIVLVALALFGRLAISAQRPPNAASERAQAPTAAPSAFAATRPAAATDDVVRSAVGAAIESCAVSTAVRSVACPPEMQPPSEAVSNPGWTLAGDPSAGATVTFDASTGLFDVVGRYTIATPADLGLVGVTHQLEPVARGYEAVVRWDAGAARVLELRAAG